MERQPAEHGHDGPSFTLNLPMMTVQFRPPRLHLPHLPRVNRQEAGHAVDVARTLLPPPDRMIYYGGLGALAVAGLIEWPVAAAIGVGTLVAQRARAERRPESPVFQPAAPSDRTPTAAPTTTASGRASGARTATARTATTAAGRTPATRTATSGTRTATAPDRGSAATP
ncbi:hypothetical protein CA984_18115 [Streptosporangium minutum]|uniref:Uncharacterized protein n=1 Tax=Streptosporangium minutum TaxID=569862 RepID=A0A243RL34_9ACTN|nr:hypothetical protein CA984_18115 [Streptosporangium minutum]